MKIKFKNVCLRLVLALSVMFLLLPCSLGFVSAEAKTIYKTEPKVYITDYGDCYHSSTCGYLRSRNAVGLYYIRDLGYRACSACGGTPSGTIRVEYYDYEFYDTVPPTSSYSSTYPSTKKNNKSDNSYIIWIIFGVAVLAYVGIKLYNYFKDDNNSSDNQ
jgi:hypothetical protein